MVDIDALVESKGLFSTEFPEEGVFSWRLLSLKEYQVFRGLRQSQTLDELTLYNMIFERCYAGNKFMLSENIKAGICFSIGQLIMWLSGDCAEETQKDDLELARHYYPAQNVTEVLKRIVLIAFPSYTLDDVEKWTRPELIRKFTIAEAVLVNKGGYEYLDTSQIMTEAEAIKKENAQTDKHYIEQNRELQSAVGDDNHILDQHPAVLEQRIKKSQKLEKRQARLLDRAQRR